MPGRIPTAEDLSGGASVRPSGNFMVNRDVADATAIARGAQSLGEGLAQVGRGLGVLAEEEKRKKSTAELAQADAAWLRGTVDIGTSFEKDTQYQTFDKRASDQTAKLKADAASMITDPDVRQQWLDQTELKSISLVAAINDKGRTIERQTDRAKLDDALTTNAEMLSDPTVPVVVREQAHQNMTAAIDVAASQNLISPEEAQILRQKQIDGSLEQLALNKANLAILINPYQVHADLAVPDTADGAGIGTALAQASGGNMPPLEFSLAKVTADLIGDANFPSTPAEAKAYLSDPAKALEYQKATVAMLTDRYKGDLGAAVIAMSPNGGTELADKWVKSHDDSILPADVKRIYKNALAAYTPPPSGVRIPVQSAPGVDLARTDPNVLTKWEATQSNFGVALTLTSAHRDAAHNAAVGGASKSQHLDGEAIDVDTSELSQEQVVRLIRTASAQGFTGIGVYKGSIHLDLGGRRAWGPSYHSDSVPAWAKDAVAEHMAGTAAEHPVTGSGVAPQYAKLSFDQRLQLAARAKAAMAQEDVKMRSSLDTIVDNAPAAISNTGTYDGDMPTATAFVQAYGADEGVTRFHAFQAAVDTSKTIYGMRTMSSDEILAQVDAAKPTSTGNDALLETKRFDAVSTAADNVLKARAADPAGYVLNTFPTVQNAFKAATEGSNWSQPAYFQSALTMMQKAQDRLGISPDQQQLLPKAQAAGAVGAFKDETLPASKRMGAVLGLVLRTSDETQQLAIYNQLESAGVDRAMRGVVGAIARGDEAAATTLMRAVMIDPAKLAAQSSVKQSEVNARLQDKVFDSGEIGDIIYGVTDGSADAMARLQGDSELMQRAVMLRLQDGSAGGNLDKAVDLTVRDMFGNVQALKKPNVRVTIPADADPGAMADGFNALLPDVRKALTSQTVGQNLDAFPVDTGARAVIGASIDNYVDLAVTGGYFVNAGDDKYSFFNPYTHSVVSGPDHLPLTFTRNEVVAARAINGQAARTAGPGGKSGRG